MGRKTPANANLGHCWSDTGFANIRPTFCSYLVGHWIKYTVQSQLTELYFDYNVDRENCQKYQLQQKQTHGEDD